MAIGAISQAVSSQNLMGNLIDDVLSQATELIKTQQVSDAALQNVEVAAKAVDSSLGNLIDITS